MKLQMIQTKTEIVAGISGTGVAVAPAVMKATAIPWYESGLWMSIMAAGGATVVALTIVHLLIRIAKEKSEWDGRERRK